jgi:uncharacterized protein YaeQ
MALTATIFKAHLQISDLDRPYYGDHQLTLARHPSETEERMMVRLLAFALHADENLRGSMGTLLKGSMGAPGSTIGISRWRTPPDLVIFL